MDKQVGARVAEPVLAHLARFANALRAAGLPVNAASLIELCQCFRHVDIADRGDFRAAARATLVRRHEDLFVFDQVFGRFWGATRERSAPPDPMQDQENEGEGDDDSEMQILMAARLIDAAEEPPGESQEAGSDGYSVQEILMQQDLGALSERELEQARRCIAELVAALASERGRRYASAKRGTRPDFRRMLRRLAFHGPECVPLRFQRKKIRKPRLILLCDVSGSMERYSHFLIEFIFALRRALPAVDVGVFATRLTMITPMLAAHDVGQSLAQVTQQVRDWGGGTDIGGCLREFNQHFAGEMPGSRSVVVILSDGWDRGDPRHMRDALETLRRQTHGLLWLNPLLGSEGYQPLCNGIKDALPFVDQMLPAHNLASLANAVRVLRELWR